ncbi:hypothetical protein NDU88_001834 [Pleurodeles waltl]|uniref:Uncharacterized protein n=1 Tax=Pleurodeles waltl TaxID=8319 RepID=A0AAV7W028_PLEWA|nr:hypothetical protein NDU88_001834 [Pleurodeles waltl]
MNVSMPIPLTAIIVAGALGKDVNMEPRREEGRLNRLQLPSLGFNSRGRTRSVNATRISWKNRYEYLPKAS